MTLPAVWFAAVAVLWTGFLLLEGFDFGVAALLPVLGRDRADRELMLRSIGPVWDGNEVWLVTAAGAVYLAVIAILPMVALDMIGTGSQLTFSGASLLIMVGVGLDTVKQIESQLRQHDYAGFLRKPAREGGELAGTSGAVAALTLS